MHGGGPQCAPRMPKCCYACRPRGHRRMHRLICRDKCGDRTLAGVPMSAPTTLQRRDRLL